MSESGSLRPGGRARLGVFAAVVAVFAFPSCYDPPISKRRGTGGAAGLASGGAAANAGDAGAATRGGTASEGGASGSGGEAQGGSVTTGGDVGSGGDPGEGGTSATGGDVGSGGDPGEGGTMGSGGKAPVTGGTGTSGGKAGLGGGSSTGGTGGVSEPRPDFILGADISSVQEAVDAGIKYVDTDGIQKSMVGLLAAHGFNAIRLRTFVDPMNLYGYANPNGDLAYVKDQAYCDRDHTATFGKEVKDAGMQLLVDLHYSDNWADPGKQVIPERWRDATSIEDLGDRVKTYTSEAIRYLVEAGARPDIVQIGNEIAPGLLIQIPAEPPNADQWGNMSMQRNAINGAVPNWADLGLLLRKGIEGVHEVDPDIQIMLHLANTSNTSGVLDWVTNVQNNGVEFDILGLSCYTVWHGQPAVWEYTLQNAARTFPNLKFMIAEYGVEARRANDIIRALPDKRGLGTFVWEPTQSGQWGPSMFTSSSVGLVAIGSSFAVYDTIRQDYGMP